MGINTSCTVTKRDTAIKYPILAQHRATQMMVLFTSAATGTVVHTGNINNRTLGEWGNDWTPPSDGNVWYLPPTGTTITLEQA